MNIKLATIALCACSISFLPAQTIATDKSPAERAESKIKPEGPLEVLAFKVMGLIGGFPDIVQSVKDDATPAAAAAAQVKLKAMSAQLKAYAVELKKLDKPSNEARKKLKAKLEPGQIVMKNKMQAAVVGMQQLDPETAAKVAEIFNDFGQKMKGISPVMKKYFEPDPEPEEGGNDEREGGK